MMGAKENVDDLNITFYIKPTEMKSPDYLIAYYQQMHLMLILF
jgi:hypothetical protein